MKIDFWTICLITAIIFFIIKTQADQQLTAEVQKLFTNLTNNRQQTLNDICECGNNYTIIKITPTFNITERLK